MRSIMDPWKTTPMSHLTAGSPASLPNTSTTPESRARVEHMMDSVVLLPAPLGPRKAKNDPAGTSNPMPSTARTPS